MENIFEKIEEKHILNKEEIELNCSEHPREIVIAFCDTCQKAVCFDCSRESHRDHKCFKIENKAVEARQNIPKLCSQIENKKLPTLVATLDKVNNCKSQVSKTDEVIEKIHKRANELMAIIMEERDSLIDQCKQSSISQEKYYQIEDSVVRRFIDLYTLSLHEASDVVKSTNNIELVLFESKLKSQIRDFKPRAIRPSSTPKFKSGKSDREVIKNMFGQVNCDVNFADMSSLAGELVGIQVKLVSSVRYSCLNVASFCLQDNELTWINPAESTIGGVIDIKGTEHKRFDFGTELSDFTITDRNVILGTDTKNKRIVRVTNNGILKEVLNTAQLQPHGIHACRNGDLLVSQMYRADPKSIDSKRLVHRLGKDYTVKLTIQFTASFFNKRHILNHPRRVTENSNGDIIVVDLSTETSGRVLAFDFVGKLRFTYEGNPKRSKFLPFDVCCDSDLRVFVSDFFNHEINVIGCDGQFIQEIPTNMEGLLNPIAIAFDKKGKLWIGGKGGKILIYMTHKTI